MGSTLTSVFSSMLRAWRFSLCGFFLSTALISSAHAQASEKAIESYKVDDYVVKVFHDTTFRTLLGELLTVEKNEKGSRILIERIFWTAVVEEELTDSNAIREWKDSAFSLLSLCGTAVPDSNEPHFCVLDSAIHFGHMHLFSDHASDSSLKYTIKTRNLQGWKSVVHPNIGNQKLIIENDPTDEFWRMRMVISLTSGKVVKFTALYSEHDDFDMGEDPDVKSRPSEHSVAFLDLTHVDDALKASKSVQARIEKVISRAIRSMDQHHPAPLPLKSMGLF